MSGANGAVWVRLTWASQVQANRSSGRPCGCPSSRTWTRWPTHERETCKLREDTQNHEMPASSEKKLSDRSPARTAAGRHFEEDVEWRGNHVYDTMKSDRACKKKMCVVVQVRQWHFLMHWLQASTSGSLLLPSFLHAHSFLFFFFVSSLLDFKRSEQTKKVFISLHDHNLELLRDPKKKSARSPHD